MRGREVLLFNGMICIAYGGVIYRGEYPLGPAEGGSS
jgi:hypothetical protein